MKWEGRKGVVVFGAHGRHPKGDRIEVGGGLGHFRRNERIEDPVQLL